MKQSDSITNLLRSLIAAQLKISSAVTKDANNEVFSSQYATLGAVISATKYILLSEGIIILQSPGEYVNSTVSVTTRFCHSSGEWIQGTCSTPLEYADPQGFGSGVSYLRRYAMTAMLGLHQADDDATAASPRGAASTANVIAKAASISGDKTASTVEASAQMLQQWKKNIANASPDRLKLAKETAKTKFSGADLTEILALIEQHLVAANEVADPFNM